MIDIPNLVRWLMAIRPAATDVAIDDGGLTLVALDSDGGLTGARYEIGGTPRADEDADSYVSDHLNWNPPDDDDSDEEPPTQEEEDEWKYAMTIDRLCDLMHFCDSNNISFEDSLRIARGHFAEETMRPVDDQDTTLDKPNVPSN